MRREERAPNPADRRRRVASRFAHARVSRRCSAIVVLVLGSLWGPLARAQRPVDSPVGADLDDARAALERGDVEAAERLYRRRLISAPDQVEALVGWARALAAQGRSVEAGRGLLRAAQRALRRGSSRSAASLLETASGMAPELGELWASYGEALLLEQRHREAQRVLETAHRLEPRDPSVRLQLAAACWENGRLEEALDHYRSVVEELAGWPVGWYQLGRFLVWQGRFEEALEPLERAIELGLDGVDVLLERARALDGVRGSSGDPEIARRAVSAWRAVVERAPEEAFARYGLAQALRALGEQDASRRELEIYAALYRRDQERTRQAGLERARIDGARAEIAAGRGEPALDRLTGLEETVEVLELRARAETLLGRPGEAAALLERALAMDPGRSDIRLRLDRLRSEGPPG